jgi:hypothetical protein
MNSYAYGSFKGNASEWMEKYFDAFLYMANWGTHRFMLRLPASILPPEAVGNYCAGKLVTWRVAGKNVIIEFRSEDEDCPGDWVEDDNDTLASLLPVRHGACQRRLERALHRLARVRPGRRARG